MRNLILNLTFILSILSCSKDNDSITGTFCAKCIEAKSNYSPPDYCGSSSDVDFYISELKRQGSQVGQSWSCNKFKK